MEEESMDVEEEVSRIQIRIMYQVPACTDFPQSNLKRRTLLKRKRIAGKKISKVCSWI